MIRVDETDPVGELEPSFPYRDVTVRKNVEFKDYYDIESEIGRGKFGTVYRCKEKKTGLSLATKVVNTTRKEDRRDVEREVDIMRKLQHPRLIQLYDAIEHGKQIYVVLELIEGGELFERVIDDDFVLTERSCAVFMRQICEGMEFVHSQNILHLDMKPENILCLTKEGNRIKIIDFGLAREYDPKKKLQVLFGTPEFVAPEVVNFDQIGFGTDMWSIGVICYVLLSGLSPFMGDTDVETMANVTIAKYDFDHEAFAEISADAKDFIKSLLVKDIAKRASAKQCREHRWLARKQQPAQPKPVAVATPVPVPVQPAPPKQQEQPQQKPPPPQQQQKAPSPPPKAATAVVPPKAVPIQAASTSHELDVTKDNLRLFVERWREHPDSPYGIETTITATRSEQETTASLRAQSPSPCGSICSNSVGSEDDDAGSDVDPESPETGGNSMLCNPYLAAPELAFALERRASEGGRLTDRKKLIDPASQILLAEEIIRLSEHLRSIASSPPTSPESKSEVDEAKTTTMKATSTKTSTKTTNAKNKTKTTTTKEKQKQKQKEEVIERDVNEISEKLSSIAMNRKLNGTTFNGSRNLDKYGAVNEDRQNFFTLRRTTTTTTTTKTSSTIVHDDLDDKNSCGNASSSKSSSISSSGSNSTISSIGKSSKTNRDDQNEGWHGTRLREMEQIKMDLTPPWRQSARVKRRFGETCRDVPRISNLQNLHKNMNLNVNLSEPASTKNLLLQLIDEWSEARRPGDLAGRKSISLDWCSGEESVARKSINSLAEYFQSEQKQQQQQKQVPVTTAGGGGGTGSGSIR